MLAHRTQNGKLVFPRDSLVGGGRQGERYAVPPDCVGVTQTGSSASRNFPTATDNRCLLKNNKGTKLPQLLLSRAWTLYKALFL